MKINVEKAKVKEWLDGLSTASREKYYPELWKRVHRLTAVPARRRASVNLYKIDKYTKEGDLVVVPGKVLSIGEMKHKVTIAAIDFSAPALKVEGWLQGSRHTRDVQGGFAILQGEDQHMGYNLDDIHGRRQG